MRSAKTSTLDPVAHPYRLPSLRCAQSDALKIVVLERNMTTIHSLTHLSDDQLIARVHTLASDERRATVALIASLVEFEARRLFLSEGCSSLFTYCTQVLHLSEHAAYERIEAARAARRFPVLLDLLADGDLTLTAICLLAPRLTEENHQDVLVAARHKTKREVELLVATLRPRPAVAAIVRKLPQPKPIAENPAVLPLAAESSSDLPISAPLDERPSRPAVVTPLAPERYKLQVTLSAQTYATLRRAQDLLRHSIPNGDPAAIVERALTLLVRELEGTKYAESDRCRAHNAYEADRWNGTLFAQETPGFFWRPGVSVLGRAPDREGEKYEVRAWAAITGATSVATKTAIQTRPRKTL